jgi:DNA-binding response OmpR family regulator
VELPPPPAGMSSRVLVGDDDTWHRERAAELMREAGHNVVTADNGVKALGMALQVEPDIILSDVQMPVMDGWQLVRMLRARPTLAQIPVIFVTALDSDEQRLQGYRLGVDDYIAKPFNDDELALRVQRVLERARAYPRNIASSKALRGTLSHVSLASLLAFVEVEQRTGLLLIVRPDEIATLYLRDGNIVRIDLPETVADLEGVERLHFVLNWTDGRFELAEAEVDDEDTIGVATSAALLEHAQRNAGS